VWEPFLTDLARARGTPRGESHASENALAAANAELERRTHEAAQMRWTSQGLVSDIDLSPRSHDFEVDYPAAQGDAAHTESDDVDALQTPMQLRGEGAKEAASMCDASAMAESTAVSPPDAAEVFSTLAECSAVVGMHPDGATEAIVDFALATDKIFAVVPCCVYSTAFPSRRGPGGRPVTSYDAFVEFLVQKAPDRIAVATLPFEGKNKVVFSIPRSQLTCLVCD